MVDAACENRLRRTVGAGCAGALLVLLCSAAPAGERTPLTLATMPRVDVHAHIRDTWDVIDQYMELRAAIKKDFNADLALWISLGTSRAAEPPDLKELEKRYNGRVLWTISDYTIADGLRFSPQELIEWHQRGVAGFKFYPGWQPNVHIDAPEHEPVFATMEKIGMVAASPHVANPCGTFGHRNGWIPDPVVYWQHQRRWENVLARHPKLVVVNAHMLWACYSDDQLDWLRYLLTTYPNLHVDVATVPEFVYNVNRDNLRDFMLQFADRVLFGTDMGTPWFGSDLGGGASDYQTRGPNYKRYFDWLETDKTLPSDFVDVSQGQKGVRLGQPGRHTIQGLALPQDVLEKIYFRNAMRIYPQVKANLKRLGYAVD